MRQSTSEESSLELLLDTICNTFGGILFISILVVVLLNTTSEAIQRQPPSPAAQSKMLQRDIERDQLTSELAGLQRALGQREGVVGTILSDEVRHLAEKLKKAQADRSGLIIDKSDVVRSLNSAQSDLNKLAQADSDRKSKRLELEKKLAAIKVQLDQKIAANSKLASIPKVRYSNLAEATYFLKQGKLYGPYLPGLLNSPDFVFTKQDGVDVLEPAPNSGLSVNPDGSNKATVAAKFSGIDRTRYGVKIFAWPDSHEHFEAVRLAIVEGYELVPVEADTVITLGHSSGSGMFLQ